MSNRDCNWYPGIEEVAFFVVIFGMPLCLAAWEGLKYVWKELSCIL